MKNSYFGFAGVTIAAATALNMAGVANASVAGMQGLYAKNYIVDAFEALAGAIYLDSDLATVQKLVLKWYGPLLDRLVLAEDAENPKGRLQELIQPAHGNVALRYEVLTTTGPLHARTFSVAVILHEQTIGTGQGSSKKSAEEEAARAGLIFLRTTQPVLS